MTRLPWGGLPAWRKPLGILPVFCLSLFLTSCASHPAPITSTTASSDPPTSDMLAPGVVHRAIATSPDTGIDLVDVDLAHANVRIEIATRDIKRIDGMVTGVASTPREWLDQRHALAATNGGYFGAEATPTRKEILGLLIQDGRVRRSVGTPHSAFGITLRGAPQIAWAATDAQHPPTPHVFSSVQKNSASRLGAWNVSAAIGCGPTLLHGGRIVVTDRQERLVSPGSLPRTFAAIDRVSVGGPAHFVLGVASGMTFRTLASFLARYFPRYDHTRPSDAMCLDGGASTQLSYRDAAGQVHSPLDTGVTVPDAILIVPR